MAEATAKSLRSGLLDDWALPEHALPAPSGAGAGEAMKELQRLRATCVAVRAHSRSRSPRRTGATTPAADGTDARASAPTVLSPEFRAGLAKWLNLTETEKHELAQILKLKLSVQTCGRNTTQEHAAHSALAQRSLSVWVLKILCARPWGRRANECGLLGPPCPRTLAAWHHLAERRSACRDGTQRRRVHARIWTHLDAMTHTSSTQDVEVFGNSLRRLRLFRGVRLALRRKHFQEYVAVIAKATAADCEKALETQNNLSKGVEAVAADSTLPQVPTTSSGSQREALNSLPCALQLHCNTLSEDFACRHVPGQDVKHTIVSLARGC